MQFLPSSHPRPTGFRCAAECSCRHRCRIPVIFPLCQHGPDATRHFVGAMATSMRGFFAIMRASQEPPGAPFRDAHRTTAMAPMISSRRISRWPIFEVFPSRCLPPVDLCNGTSPSQAAKSRPHLNVSVGGAKVSIASAAMGPTPGMVCKRRDASASLDRASIVRRSGQSADRCGPQDRGRFRGPDQANWRSPPQRNVQVGSDNEFPVARCGRIHSGAHAMR